MTKVPRILYVEDSSNDIELTLAAFRECQIVNEIDVVRDGEEAINYLFFKGVYSKREKMSPAFALLDIKMPKMDGVEVLKIIRQSTEYRALPVVMLTSSKVESDVMLSYELGANGFVIKPVEFGKFVNAIKSIGNYWAVFNTSPMSI